MLTALAAVLWACGGLEQDPRAAALKRWDAAQTALERGDDASALESLVRAREFDPDSPALSGWHAEVLRRLDRPSEALAVLDEALSQFPAHAELRHQRAWLRMRNGMTDLAVKDLGMLVEDGILTPSMIANDPSFDELRRVSGAEWLVPAPELAVEIEASSTVAIVGERWSISMVIDAPEAGRLRVHSATAESTAPVRLISVVEDELSSGPGHVRRRLTWTFVISEAGEVQLGPWRVSVDEMETLTATLPLEGRAVGLRQQAGERWLPQTMPVPTTVFAEGEQSRWRDADRPFAHGAPTERKSVAYEVRLNGQTQRSGSLARSEVSRSAEAREVSGEGATAPSR